MRNPKNKQGRKASKRAKVENACVAMAFMLDEVAKGHRVLAGALCDFDRAFYAAALKVSAALKAKNPAQP
jgi:hypothetical protein